MKVTTRLADVQDVDRYLEYTRSTANNLFDPSIAHYPSLRTLAIDINGKPSLYVPFHPVIVVESLAHRPDTTPRENAYALNEAQKALEKMARTYGMAESWWMCSDPTLIQIALRHGYKEVQTAVLRKKFMSGDSSND